MKKFLTMIRILFGIEKYEYPEFYYRDGTAYFEWELDAYGEPIDHSKHFIMKPS